MHGMEELVLINERLVEEVSIDYKRDLYDIIN